MQTKHKPPDIRQKKTTSASVYEAGADVVGVQPASKEPFQALSSEAKHARL